jgi:mono/diheme cytochrome c family protein
MSRVFAALLSSLLAMTLANAAAAADAANGEKLAKRWCAACHVVASDQRQGTTQAAPFSAIAKEPGVDAARIALYLLLPHPKMPDMNLSRGEAADLAAYIAAQGK